MVYSITYDLRKEGNDYDDLYKVIKSLGDWHHPLESTWFVDSPLSSCKIKDKLIAVMDSNDLLFISQITTGYSGWLLKKTWTWLSDHIH